MFESQQTVNKEQQTVSNEKKEAKEEEKEKTTNKYSVIDFGTSNFNNNTQTIHPDK